MYTDSYTSVTVGGKTTRWIKINLGPKQGCPLSPLVFSLIIDEMIVRLKRLGISIKLRDNLVSVMAFADDLVLLTKNSSHMLIAIKERQRFLDQKRFKVNADKCGSLRVLPVKGKSVMKVIFPEHRAIRVIEALSCTLHTKINKIRGNPDLLSK